jgi:transcriptional regulator with XRE-family HTH domain
MANEGPAEQSTLAAPIRPPARPVSRMRDIAAAAGVAPSTVSRVLNSAPSRVPIAAETRERVLAAAARLGYRPNPLARGLLGSATMLIGAVVRDFSDPFFAAAMESLAVEAMARGCRARGKIVRVERARIPAERRRCGGGEVQVVGRPPARLAPPGVQRIDLVARQHGVVYEMAGLLGGQTCRIGGSEPHTGTFGSWGSEARIR